MSLTGTDLRTAGGYTIPGFPDPLVSVTKICDNLMATSYSDAFSYWVASHVAELVGYAQQKKTFPAWKKVTLEGREHWMLIDSNPRDLLVDVPYLQSHARRMLRKAADRGTCCHHVAGYYAAGISASMGDIPDMVDQIIIDERLSCTSDEVVRYAESLWGWLTHWKPEFLVSEHTVFHDVLGYAGTLDGIVKFDGKLWVLDIKTSKVTDEKHACQLAAYRHAKKIVTHTGAVEDMIRTSGAVVLKISPDNAMWRPWNATGHHFTQFKRLLRVWRYLEANHSAEKRSPFSLDKRAMSALTGNAI